MKARSTRAFSESDTASASDAVSTCATGVVWAGWSVW